MKQEAICHRINRRLIWKNRFFIIKKVTNMEREDSRINHACYIEIRRNGVSSYVFQNTDININMIIDWYRYECLDDIDMFVSLCIYTQIFVCVYNCVYMCMLTLFTSVHCKAWV